MQVVAPALLVLPVGHAAHADSAPGASANVFAGQTVVFDMDGAADGKRRRVSQASDDNDDDDNDDDNDTVDNNDDDDEGPSMAHVNATKGDAAQHVRGHESARPDPAP